MYLSYTLSAVKCILIFHLSFFSQTEQTNRFYRHRSDPKYEYRSDARLRAPDYYYYYDDEPYNIPVRRQRGHRSERDYYYNDEYIANFNEDNSHAKSSQKPMLKITDLTQMSKTHGKGLIRDPMAEEKVLPDADGGIRSRSVKRRVTQKNDNFGKNLSEENCGESDGMDVRIVGGEDVPEGLYPWIVAIFKNGEAWCGGTILNSRWIITASHCFMGDDRPNRHSWAIRVGTVNKNRGKTYRIGKIITHERFNVDSMLNSDIALLKTTIDIEYTKYVKPVCLPDNEYQEPRVPKLRVAGWGARQFDDDENPVILQDVSLFVVKDSDCAKKYKIKRYTLYKSQFCTWNHKKDSCQGDSGGPAIEYYDGKAYLIGVVSFGSTCADDFPGVYTQLSYFLKWISKTIKNN